MTIRHIVMWKMAATDAVERRAHAEEVAERLNALSGVITQAQSISAGANSLYPEANWDVTLISDFASVEDLEAYQVHPAHVEAGRYIRSVAGSRAAVDFIV